MALVKDLKKEQNGEQSVPEKIKIHKIENIILRKVLVVKV